MILINCSDKLKSNNSHKKFAEENSRMKAPKSFFLLILLFAFPVFAQSGDEQAVRETVGKFCDAIIRKDLGKLKETTDANWNEAALNSWQNMLERGIFVQYPLRSFTIRTVKIEAEEATVRVFWERIDAKTNQPVGVFQENHRLFFLKKQNSLWKINNLITVENDLIARILNTDSFEERKHLIRSEPELNTHRVIFVILFRLQSDGKYEQTEEFYKLAEWYNDEFYKSKIELTEKKEEKLRLEAAYFNTIANVLNSRALTQKSLGNYAGAMRFYLESAKISEEFQIKTGKIIPGTALTQVNVGSLYFQQGNLEQAEKFALNALKTLEGADRIKQNVLFNSIYNLLGDIYFQRGDLPKAFEFYVQAKDGESHGIGAIYLKQNKLPEALKIFQFSIEAMERLVIQKGQVNLPLAVEAYSNLTEIYRRQNDAEKALQTARRAIEFAVLTR
jgi:tetratricopeptide (TPR) repeat protein